MLKYIKIAGTLTLFLIIFYGWPVKNAENIAPDHMKTYITAGLPNWDEFHEILSDGNCFKALYYAYKTIGREAGNYWIGRMFELGVCFPQDQELALTFSVYPLQKGYGFLHEQLRLAYYVETGVGVEAAPQEAYSLYLEALINDDGTPAETLHKFITQRFNFVFSGNFGSPAFEKAFEAYALQREPN